jgi:hypothetical protein
MRSKNLWVRLTLLNLCALALIGFLLRTKFLFPIPFIDYRNLLSAHSHFAFGGWATLALMVLLIDSLLDNQSTSKKGYQVILWGIHGTSWGMLLSFPFQGYAAFSIIFSTSFIFLTYWFAWKFISDLRKQATPRPVFLLAVCGVLSMVVSSIGPFALAYMMATQTGDGTNFREAVYTFLHFMYNGFFTLSVFALFFNSRWQISTENARKKISYFAFLICLSIVPSLFLALLWHPHDYIKWLAYTGCVLILVSLGLFLSLGGWFKKAIQSNSLLVRSLLILFLISFLAKSLLQTGTVFPWLAHAVFGLRPIIIGFLHLVFLGLVSFYILSHYMEKGYYPLNTRFSRISIIFFTGAVLFNELVLLVDGIGLLMFIAHDIYGWLLWVASILLLTGSVLIATSRMRS